MILAYPKIRGREHLRGIAGPILVACNHVTYLDVGFVLAALPPRLRHRLAVSMDGENLAAMRRPPKEKGFFRAWIERISYVLVVSLFNVFPLPRRSGYRESFAYAGELTDRGESILIFPEGELTPDGEHRRVSSRRRRPGIAPRRAGGADAHRRAVRRAHGGQEAMRSRERYAFRSASRCRFEENAKAEDIAREIRAAGPRSRVGVRSSRLTGNRNLASTP